MFDDMDDSFDDLDEEVRTDNFLGKFMKDPINITIKCPNEFNC